jgi:N-(2-amino-2-carboxyethyl)-L-glutamate synthase
MLQELRREGRLDTHGSVVESTSGNMGVALAWIARALGYRFRAITDPNATAENVSRMRALGADVEILARPDESGSFVTARIARARAVARVTGAVLVNQYESPANPLTHFLWTGPEILSQVEVLPAAILIPVSTGGTLAGIGGRFRLGSPATVVVAVDGEGSSLFGGRAGPRAINGLGSSHPSAFVRPSFYDEVMQVKSAEAVACCRHLHAETGLMIGGSGGATVAAAARYLRRHPEVRQVIAICPDNGAHYRSTIFASTLSAEPSRLGAGFSQASL